MKLTLQELWQTLAHLPPALAVTTLCAIVLAMLIIIALPIVLGFLNAQGVLSQTGSLQQMKNTGPDACEMTALKKDWPNMPSQFILIERMFKRPNLWAASVCCWLILVIALTQFAIVILRYLFAFGSLPMQESVWYMHGTFFMMGAGYTLLMEAHVRLDVFYRKVSRRTRALVDLLGSLFLLIPVCITTWWFSWRYVASAWAIQEGSAEITGLPFLYLYKTVLLIFVALMICQAVVVILFNTILLATSGTTHNEKVTQR